MTISLHYFVSLSLDSVAESHSWAYDAKVHDKTKEDQEGEEGKPNAQLGCQRKAIVLNIISRFWCGFGRSRLGLRSRNSGRFDLRTAFDDVASVRVG